MVRREVREDLAELLLVLRLVLQLSQQVQLARQQHLQVAENHVGVLSLTRHTAPSLSLSRCAKPVHAEWVYITLSRHTSPPWHTRHTCRSGVYYVAGVGGVYYYLFGAP